MEGEEAGGSNARVDENDMDITKFHDSSALVGFVGDVVGVRYRPKSGKPWLAQMFYARKPILYATFSTKKEACTAHDVVVRFVYQDNACSNFSIDGTVSLSPRAGVNAHKIMILHNPQASNQTTTDKANMMRGIYCRQQLVHWEETKGKSGVMPFKRTNIYKLLKPDRMPTLEGGGSGSNGNHGNRSTGKKVKKATHTPEPPLQLPDQTRISRHAGIYRDNQFHMWRADLLLEMGASEPPQLHVVGYFKDEDAAFAAQQFAMQEYTTT